MKADLYADFCSLRVRLDRDAFSSAIQEWPASLVAELRQLIRNQFGDENFTTVSIRHAAMHLREWPLDSLSQSALIRLGECPPEATEILEERLKALRRFYWYFVASAPDTSFSCLDALPDSTGAALVRGLAFADEFGYLRYNGSVSLVCDAFRAFQQKDIASWTALAEWLVTNSSNPWVPFRFQRTRSQWAACQSRQKSPTEVWRNVCDLDKAQSREKRRRENHNRVRTAIAQFRAGTNLEALNNPELRQRMIEEMERDILDL